MALLDTACLIAGMLRGTRSRCAVMRSMVAVQHNVGCISTGRAMRFGSGTRRTSRRITLHSPTEEGFLARRVHSSVIGA
jgi:hypothetical protein